jgi:hypothetical protein
MTDEGKHPTTAAKPTTDSAHTEHNSPWPLPSRPPATDLKVRQWRPSADPATLAKVKKALERL